MSLIIGIRVKEQDDDYQCDGNNPRGTRVEIRERLVAHLERKLPLGGFGGVGVDYYDGEYDFDVQVWGYGRELEHHGYTVRDLYLAMIGFVLEEFSVVEGIRMEAYGAG